jgi:nitrate reductase alpha subunit
MIIIGAAMNHWYHMDMNYRSAINMLVMCGCVGQVGRAAGRITWARRSCGRSRAGPRSPSPRLGPPAAAAELHLGFYAHTDQWRYETLDVKEILSPTARRPWDGAIIDYNIRAERMGWLPSAPQLEQNPLTIAKKASCGLEPEGLRRAEPSSRRAQHVLRGPDNPKNWPRNLFVWRSNLLGSSARGHEYFLKHLLGTSHWGARQGSRRGRAAKRRRRSYGATKRRKGKLDLLVTLDFRMSTTCVYSDIVLPTATWYEKDDLNTSDMQPRSSIRSPRPWTRCGRHAPTGTSTRGLGEKFSGGRAGGVGTEKDVV